MNIKLLSLTVGIMSSLFCINLQANIKNANPGNYTGFLNSLAPGDTLNLAAGNYINNLKLTGLNGTSYEPIVITGQGNTTIFQAQSCCNTVSITQCSYLIIKNLQLDGMNQAVDAVKGEGTTGNWAHHITLEYLSIINYGSDQQNVGISTKCAAWDWLIRKNKIIGAGTGMYLGNSDGTKPFVNGIIEYNLIANTVGYNIEIKHQLNNVRDEFPGIAVNGKTIIRHNVFTKDETSSTDANARPNLLVGGFPLTGWGSIDYYEIYGNFFYNNPVEALFQGTGNINLYENIFVNHFDPAGSRAIYITPQNGVSPQDIKVFHNTIWVLNSSGGIRLYSPNSSYQQYCYGNAVFAPSPITNFSNSLDNITDDYANAINYLIAATTNINSVDLYPKAGQLTGTLTPSTLFENNTFWSKDFNQDVYNWTYRGAYSGCCNNKGWKLQLDTISTPGIITNTHLLNNEAGFQAYPNPVSSTLSIKFNNPSITILELYIISGVKKYSIQTNQSQIDMDLSEEPSGAYILFLKNQGEVKSGIIIKE